MLLKRDASCFGKLILGLSSGVQLQQKRERLMTHRLLDHWELVQPGATEDGLQPNARGLDATLATRSLQCGSQLWPSQTSRLGRRCRNRQNGAGIWMRQSMWTTILK